MMEGFDPAAGGDTTGIKRSGFVSIIGRPNVGKSTLMNHVLGEKIVITSAKPQTTRNRITGVVNRGDCQLVFIDTPGVHDSPKLINAFMNRQALSTLSEVDTVLFMVDAQAGLRDGDRALAEKLSTLDVPVVLVVNKVDGGGRDVEIFSSLGDFHRSFKVSALTGEGVEAMMEYLAGAMPEGPVYYPDDAITDRPERFIAAEYIREKVFTLTSDEIPYSVAVSVDLWEDKPEKNLSVIHATIHVERKSQKGIIIGQGGKLIKRIGRLARMDLEKLLNTRVYLDLHVGVEHNWTKDERQLKRFGLDSE